MVARFWALAFWFFLSLSRFVTPFVPECFRYHRDFLVTTALTGVHDVQLEVDTASLIAAGRITDCSDLRFRHVETGNWLDFWYESSCGQTSTRIWLQPNIQAATDPTIEVYYGCRHDSGGSKTPPVGFKTEVTWSGGKFYGLTTGSCGGSWGHDSSFNNKFVRLVPLATGTPKSGTFESHTHTTSSAFPSASGSVSVSGGVGMAASSHTHSMAGISCSGPTEIPPYYGLPICWGPFLDMRQNMIFALHGTDDRDGSYDHFSGLDGSFPRGRSSCCSADGATTHKHTLSGLTSAGTTSTTGPDMLGPTDCVGQSHRHPISTVQTSTGTSMPTYLNRIFVQVVAAGGGTNTNRNFLFFANGLPPRGFEPIATPIYDNVYLRGATSPGASQVTPGSGSHFVTVNPSPANGFGVSNSGSGNFWSLETHDHASSMYSTNSVPSSNDLARVEVRGVQYVADFDAASVSPQGGEVAFECDGVYWADPAVCTGRGSCDPDVGSDCVSCDLEGGDKVYYGAFCQNEAKCDQGRLWSNPAVCSGHGKCTLPFPSSVGDCYECDVGYSGHFCEYPICFGFNRTNACSYPFGTCTAPEVCTCDEHHRDTLCDVEIHCNGTHWNDTSVCSGHGECKNDEDTCYCEYGYGGQYCELFVCYGELENDTVNACTGLEHGRCEGVDDCNCTDLWTGDECDEEIECFGVKRTALTACRHHGLCIAIDTCFCLDGYSGQECQRTGCFGTSSESSSVCGALGTCWGSDLCMCPSTFFGSQCEEELPKQVVHVTGLVSDTVLSFSIPYIMRSVYVPLDEQDVPSFNCTERIMKDLECLLILGVNARCVWETEGANTASLNVEVDQSWGDSQMFQNGEKVISLVPITIINVFERVWITLVVELHDPAADAPPSTGWVAGIVIPLLLVLLCFVVAVAVLGVFMYLYQRKLRRFEDLEGFDLLLAEQKAEKDPSQPHFRIEKSAYIIEWEDVKLQKKIGGGGSGASVYLAEYSGSLVAIKVFKTASLLGPAGEHSFEEFETEVTILSQLHHPYVLSFFGATVKHPRVGIVMEYCEKARGPRNGVGERGNERNVKKPETVNNEGSKSILTLRRRR